MEHYFNIILLGQSTTRFEVYICPIEKIVSFCFVGVFKKNYKSKNCSIKLCRTWNRNQVIARPRQTRMLLWVSKVEKTTFKSFLRKYLSIRSQEVNHTHTETSICFRQEMGRKRERRKKIQNGCFFVRETRHQKYRL